MGVGPAGGQLKVSLWMITHVTVNLRSGQLPVPVTCAVLVEGMLMVTPLWFLKSSTPWSWWVMVFRVSTSLTYITDWRKPKRMFVLLFDVPPFIIVTIRTRTEMWNKLPSVCTAFDSPHISVLFIIDPLIINWLVWPTDCCCWISIFPWSMITLHFTRTLPPCSRWTVTSVCLRIRWSRKDGTLKASLHETSQQLKLWGSPRREQLVNTAVSHRVDSAVEIDECGTSHGAH